MATSNDSTPAAATARRARSAAPAAAPASTTTTGLVWEAPPPQPERRANNEQYQPEAAELRAHPGEWALLKEFKDRSQAWRLKSRIEKGTLPAFAPAGSFEAVTRANGVIKVYARYTGEAQAETEA